MTSQEFVARIRQFIAENLWSNKPLQPAPLGWLRSIVQLSIVIAEGFVRDQLLLRAHSLTYLTLFALVPLLAIVLTALNAFGVGEDIVLQLFDQFAGVIPEDIRANILDTLENFEFGTLGAVGGGVLLGTTLWGIGNVERALNAIWGVAEQRTWARRVPDYLAVMIIAPILMGIALPLRVSLESEAVVQQFLNLPGIEQAYSMGLQYAPVLLFVLAFSFLYWFLPNTTVRLRSALIGGAVAAVLFTVAQVAYVDIIKASSRYHAILGGLASAGLLLVWIYFSWSIVLFGAEVAYASQTLALYRREVQGAPAGPAARESIGLAIALECARSFRDGSEPWAPDRLSDALNVPLRTVRDVLGALQEAGIVRPCGNPPNAVMIGRPMEQIRVSDILLALRGTRECGIAVSDVAREVSGVLGEVDKNAALASEARNLRDLVDGLRVAPGAALPDDGVDRTGADS
jgi:membrane protein